MKNEIRIKATKIGDGSGAIVRTAFTAWERTNVMDGPHGTITSTRDEAGAVKWIGRIGTDPERSSYGTSWKNLPAGEERSRIVRAAYEERFQFSKAAIEVAISKLPMTKQQRFAFDFLGGTDEEIIVRGDWADAVGDLVVTEEEVLVHLAKGGNLQHWAARMIAAREIEARGVKADVEDAADRIKWGFDKRHAGEEGCEDLDNEGLRGATIEAVREATEEEQIAFFAMREKGTMILDVRLRHGERIHLIPQRDAEGNGAGFLGWASAEYFESAKRTREAARK
jgi:hypothetical protein